MEESVARARILSGGGHRAILGITGQPGAGKSTVSRSLVSQVSGSVLLGMDAFHLAHSSLERLGQVERKGAPDTFDPAGYVALLRRIRQGKPVSYGPLSSAGRSKTPLWEPLPFPPRRL